jgi:4-hydroxybenzoate polyprenyltransferase
MQAKIKAFIELMRPANVITALTDILAGMSIVGFLFNLNEIDSVLFLGISTMCLYAGGVVFNDLFDHSLDQIERPERALPSGRIKKNEAIFGGIVLLVIGIFCAFWQSNLSGIIAVFITVLALFYDWRGKHMTIFGPLNMGLCRAFNLLLGMSVYEIGVFNYGYLILIPFIYIAAITLVSRGEVHGGTPKTLLFALILFLFVHLSQVYYAYSLGHLFLSLPFILIHFYLIFDKIIVAIKNPIGPNIGKTVKIGVLTLILMNAAWVSLSGQWEMAIFVVLLLPVSILLGKKFAVT